MMTQVYKHGHKPHILSTLPPWLSRWVGYRASPPPKQPQYVVWIWSFIGAFGGISLLQGFFGNAQYFIRRGVPEIVASYGASAVLIYGAIDAPLAQPRALVGGHFVGALVGVCITKLFHLLPTEQRFQDLIWLAGSLSCASAIVLMQMTSTTHPPAGATALLAATNAEIRAMGWYYLPVVLLSSALALIVALLTNNVQRRYPVFWYQPAVSIPAPPAPDLGGPETDSADRSSSAGQRDSAEEVNVIQQDPDRTKVNSAEKLPRSKQETSPV